MKKHQLNYYFLRLFFSINLGFSLKKVKEEMKMNKKAVMLGLVGMGLGMAPTAAAAAEANPTASMTSQATLTIEQGILSLDQVTNFNFGTSSIQEIATDEQVIQTTSNEVTSITDYRGPNQAGWQLTAQLSKMTNASDNELANAKVTLNGTTASGDAALVSGTELMVGATEPTLIASANGTTGLATNDFNFSNASLTVPKQNVNSGTYSGTITWTLANTYQAE
ncbi:MULTISPECIES: WxL domain-containing protein [Enterococcus]|uniref:WxL domain-containing protein n=1 Tax=Enterococcus TaxID=1350 RepID=UPI000E4B2C74|nr:MULTISPECIES: WxL domain-containing protein [Enterococcus]MBE9878510.1 WxL domain-containing protein [Enterococcus casseliflavus]MBE9898285.1 WxL domain-containing protein [Enterococcus casseliflavus]MBE9901571.1 WxL domain-containing protein [Enterococcus casseliflavus]MBE9921978.1 WxL domain-containing protein [Enterococcus casseliflavus]MBO6349825.1 WxL domain-containing protein [Enterococcus casseliflavus]